jgi:outer membrane protein TolC
VAGIAVAGLLAGLGCGLAALPPGPAAAQSPAPAAADPAPAGVRPARLLPPVQDGENLPPPRLVPSPAPLGPPPAPLEPGAEPWATRAEPINLPAALRLALTANLDIAQAREVVNAARAAYDRARVGILPNANIGSTYTRHDGNIAKTEGNIIKANKDALFVGGGPSLAFALTDAIFAPLVAGQVLSATRSGLQRVSNTTLLAVADAYFNVLLARRRLARIDETLDFLTSERPSPARAGARGLLPVVSAFQKAQVAEALKSEVERVRVEILRRQEERLVVVDNYLLATAELARLLRLDPQIPLWPVEDFRYPLPLPDAAWLDRSPDELVRTALNNRPELAENQALVQAAVERVREARFRPLLPSAILNYSWGGFGGDPEALKSGGFGPSGQILHFGNRSDFEASLIWRLQNLGLGDAAAVREQQALQRQATLRLRQFEELVVTQVVTSQERVVSWRRRLNSTRAALFDADGAPKGPVFESLRLNFERIRAVEKTRPLEVLDSIRGLNDALEAYAQAVTDYDRARFRLLVVLGLPPEDLLNALLAPDAGQPAPPPGPPRHD